MTTPRLLAALAAGVLAFTAAHAADTPVRVRGTVASIAGDKLVVHAREGGDVAVALNPGWQVSAVAKASLADIKPGAYVGIASLPTSAGGTGALEVLVFPPAMKGMGEGNSDWDLKPGSSMTNGSVGDAVQSVDGPVVTVNYHGQAKKITVPAGTPVVTLAGATPADLKPGATVFVPGARGDDGVVHAMHLVVGRDGVVPPM